MHRYIDTPLAAPVLTNVPLLAEVVGRTPLRRVGRPEEVSSLVAFLCMVRLNVLASVPGTALTILGLFCGCGLGALPVLLAMALSFIEFVFSECRA